VADGNWFPRACRSVSAAGQPKIREDFPDAPHLQTIAGFLRLAGDIPALYGEPLTEYGKCYEALEFLIEGVLARLKEEEEQ